ncbi:type I-F CRISPR-associated helicase Cas3f [Gallibacterium salpingitidis]|uniref:Helicase n=1 Tax=Gallibacterium salpingitidis TaxID=505341 RepID=A0A1A7NQ90_9PAST|nr:type I-F CRISPR-associated helicase Cas3f [Gallibacterium salpingitidis]OBW91798.1 helicase [Gallibacterium salpingitidis]
MNILLVSQCQKNALKETRRILDQFAERCGDRVWQTAITHAGLQTLKQLLRQTARKNTAVACYWTHGKNQTSLLWIVGDQRQFNQKGRVPTNRTQRNILRQEDEIAWHNAYSIQIISALAALLHDLGKSSIGFQEKLKPQAPFYADPYRHEWISVRIFEAMIQGCQTDMEWLTRLANWAEYQQQNPSWLQQIKIEDPTPKQGRFEQLPPIAKTIIWLISSHHRVPYLPEFAEKNNNRKKVWETEVAHDLKRFYRLLSASNGWVANPHSEHPQPKKFWRFNQLVSDSSAWQKAMTRWANKALKHTSLMNLVSNVENISDPFLLLLSRLSLITADHHYSSLNPNPQFGEKDFPLFANTDAKGQTKQRLDEHLLGVCQSAVRFARILPRLKTLLPALTHKSFNKRSDIARFQWQNRAFDLAKRLQASTEQQGFFGVNMASTGCGKTVGNTRIMYALANPQLGVRFTIALGLRVLTLQTGRALKDKLRLDDDALAVLVGGDAVNKLFALQQEKSGSESVEDWLEMAEVDGGIVGESALDNLAEFNTLIANHKAKNLLLTPLVTCTIDYLMNASECLRGGKYIVPILRLLSGDLILDEPDDFDQNDLPALSRLVHLAGLFGSKVLLSSATLTPDLVSGLFEAYQAGRNVWNQNNQLPSQGVCCAWFDEFNQQSFSCSDLASYQAQHQEFVQQRINKLKQQPTRRMAKVMSLPSVAGGENQTLNWPLFAQQLLQQAIAFHTEFAISDDSSTKRVSVGLLRFANIRPMIPTIQAMLQQQCPDNTEIHLCCYHSRQLLLLRSRLEQSLDRLLTRNDPQALFQQPEIKLALDNSQNENHIFIVVGSPVTEVGRDHDYDWAIIDPSSMRSIIQLAGRVWRHRPDKVATTPNIALLPSNWKGLKGHHYTREIFYHPGFESSEHPLISHRTQDIINPEQLAVVDAVARIEAPTELDENAKAQKTLAELEHSVMRKMFNSSSLNYVNGYWRSDNAKLAAHYTLTTPFRASQKMEDFVCLPDDESSWGYAFAYSEKAHQNLFSCNKEWHRFQYQPIENQNSSIKPWLVFSLTTALDELTEALKLKDVEQTALSYATVSLRKDEQTEAVWQFNEFLGFWRQEDQ